MTLIFVSKICKGCDELFSTSNDSDKCFNCTLLELTQGMAPEEGDFNTAAITSGTMSEQDRRNLQKDLESVEPQEDYEDEDEDDYFYDRSYADEDPDDWEYDEEEAARRGDEG